jgi:tetratricopeptide (TPR) repeat protein
MPKPIKKRVPKKKTIEENEVKSIALQALDMAKTRQKQIIAILSVIVAIGVVYVAFSLYLSSVAKKAYSLELKAYDFYYGKNTNESMSEEDRWKKAIELYQKSIDVKVTPTALYYLGNCYFNLGDYENAIKQYNLFIDKFKGETGILPLVYQKLASAYFKTNQNDKALDIIKRLAEVEGGIFKDTALILEARYYEKTGQSEKALEKYREIITQFPGSIWGAEAGSKVAIEEAKKTDKLSEEAEVNKKEKQTEEQAITPEAKKKE